MSGNNTIPSSREKYQNFAQSGHPTNQADNSLEVNPAKLIRSLTPSNSNRAVPSQHAKLKNKRSLKFKKKGSQKPKPKSHHHSDQKKGKGSSSSKPRTPGSENSVPVIDLRKKKAERLSVDLTRNLSLLTLQKDRGVIKNVGRGKNTQGNAPWGSGDSEPSESYKKLQALRGSQHAHQEAQNASNVNKGDIIAQAGTRNSSKKHKKLKLYKKTFRNQLIRKDPSKLHLKRKSSSSILTLKGAPSTHLPNSRFYKNGNNQSNQSSNPSSSKKPKESAQNSQNGNNSQNLQLSANRSEHLACSPPKSQTGSNYILQKSYNSQVARQAQYGSNMEMRGPRKGSNQSNSSIQNRGCLGGNYEVDRALEISGVLNVSGKGGFQEFYCSKSQKSNINSKLKSGTVGAGERGKGVGKGMSQSNTASNLFSYYLRSSDMKNEVSQKNPQKGKKVAPGGNSALTSSQILSQRSQGGIKFRRKYSHASNNIKNPKFLLANEHLKKLSHQNKSREIQSFRAGSGLCHASKSMRKTYSGQKLHNGHHLKQNFLTPNEAIKEANRHKSNSSKRVSTPINPNRGSGVQECEETDSSAYISLSNQKRSLSQNCIQTSHPGTANKSQVSQITIEDGASSQNAKNCPKEPNNLHSICSLIQKQGVIGNRKTSANPRAWVNGSSSKRQQGLQSSPDGSAGGGGSMSKRRRIFSKKARSAINKTIKSKLKNPNCSHLELHLGGVRPNCQTNGVVLGSKNTKNLHQNANKQEAGNRRWMIDSNKAASHSKGFIQKEEEYEPKVVVSGAPSNPNPSNSSLSQVSSLKPHLQDHQHQKQPQSECYGQGAAQSNTQNTRPQNRLSNHNSSGNHDRGYQGGAGGAASQQITVKNIISSAETRNTSSTKNPKKSLNHSSCNNTTATHLNNSVIVSSSKSQRCIEASHIPNMSKSTRSSFQPSIDCKVFEKLANLRKDSIDLTSGQNISIKLKHLDLERHSGVLDVVPGHRKNSYSNNQVGGAEISGEFLGQSKIAQSKFLKSSGFSSAKPQSGGIPGHKIDLLTDQIRKKNSQISELKKKLNFFEKENQTLAEDNKELIKQQNQSLDTSKRLKMAISDLEAKMIETKKNHLKEVESLRKHHVHELCELEEEFKGLESAQLSFESRIQEKDKEVFTLKSALQKANADLLEAQTHHKTQINTLMEQLNHIKQYNNEKQQEINQERDRVLVELLEDRQRDQMKYKELEDLAENLIQVNEELKFQLSSSAASSSDRRFCDASSVTTVNTTARESRKSVRMGSVSVDSSGSGFDFGNELSQRGRNLGKKGSPGRFFEDGGVGGRDGEQFGGQRRQAYLLGGIIDQQQPLGAGSGSGGFINIEGGGCGEIFQTIGPNSPLGSAQQGYGQINAQNGQNLQNGFFMPENQNYANTGNYGANGPRFGAPGMFKGVNGGFMIRTELHKTPIFEVDSDKEETPQRPSDRPSLVRNRAFDGAGGVKGLTGVHTADLNMKKKIYIESENEHFGEVESKGETQVPLKSSDRMHTTSRSHEISLKPHQIDKMDFSENDENKHLISITQDEEDLEMEREINAAMESSCEDLKTSKKRIPGYFESDENMLKNTEFSPKNISKPSQMIQKHILEPQNLIQPSEETIITQNQITSSNQLNEIPSESEDKETLIPDAVHLPGPNIRLISSITDSTSQNEENLLKNANQVNHINPGASFEEVFKCIKATNHQPRPSAPNRWEMTSIDQNDQKRSLSDPDRNIRFQDGTTYAELGFYIPSGLQAPTGMVASWQKPKEASISSENQNTQKPVSGVVNMAKSVNVGSNWQNGEQYSDFPSQISRDRDLESFSTNMKFGCEADSEARNQASGVVVTELEPVGASNKAAGDSQRRIFEEFAKTFLEEFSRLKNEVSEIKKQNSLRQQIAGCSTVLGAHPTEEIMNLLTIMKNQQNQHLGAIDRNPGVFEGLVDASGVQNQPEMTEIRQNGDMKNSGKMAEEEDSKPIQDNDEVVIESMEGAGNICGSPGSRKRRQAVKPSSTPKPKNKQKEAIPDQPSLNQAKNVHNQTPIVPQTSLNPPKNYESEQRLMKAEIAKLRAQNAALMIYQRARGSVQHKIRKAAKKAPKQENLKGSALVEETIQLIIQEMKNLDSFASSVENNELLISQTLRESLLSSSSNYWLGKGEGVSEETETAVDDLDSGGVFKVNRDLGFGTVGSRVPAGRWKRGRNDENFLKGSFTEKPVSGVFGTFHAPQSDSRDIAEHLKCLKPKDASKRTPIKIRKLKQLLTKKDTKNSGNEDTARSRQSLRSSDADQSSSHPSPPFQNSGSTESSSDDSYKIKTQKKEIKKNSDGNAQPGTNDRPFDDTRITDKVSEFCGGSIGGLNGNQQVQQLFERLNEKMEILVKKNDEMNKKIDCLDSELSERRLTYGSSSETNKASGSSGSGGTSICNVREYSEASGGGELHR